MLVQLLHILKPFPFFAGTGSKENDAVASTNDFKLFISTSTVAAKHSKELPQPKMSAALVSENYSFSERNFLHSAYRGLYFYSKLRYNVGVLFFLTFPAFYCMCLTSVIPKAYVFNRCYTQNMNV